MFFTCKAQQTRTVSKRQSRPADRRRVRPFLEALEDRTLPSVLVPGTANPFLADPTNHPGPDPLDGTVPPSVAVVPRATLALSVTGVTGNFPSGSFGPDPDGIECVEQNAAFGPVGRVSDYRLPLNSLVGVFWGPGLAARPPALQTGTHFTNYAPQLGQVFFIGDGLTGTGSGLAQTFRVPDGATQLFLASLDGHEWGNNAGAFTVDVTTNPLPQPPAALLEDDFNDGTLDPARWATNTTILFGPASVTEQGGVVSLVNRGHLVSRQVFDPLVVGPLTITGTWTFTNATFPAHDIMQVLTRSDGVPQGTYGETRNGIEFQANGNDFLAINAWVNGESAPLAPPVPIPINDGDTFHFAITDDGEHLSLTLQKIGGDCARATISATSSLRFATNHVVFHNREANNGSSTLSYLDNVSVIAASSPVDIAIVSAQPTNATTVWYAYRVTGSPGPFHVGLYQSADAQFDPSDAPVGALQTVVPLDGREGSGTLTLSSSLAVDPQRPFFLVVADPENAIRETDEGNNNASFRLPDVVITGVAAERHATSVVVDYEVRDAASPSFTLAIYRSADTHVDGLDEPTITLQADGGIGAHHLSIPLATPLAIDPTRPVVLAVADPVSRIPDVNRSNNVAYFHKYVVGVVTHGLDLDGGMYPAWVDGMAGSLSGVGYTLAIPFGWAEQSRSPQPGMATGAGLDLANTVVSWVSAFLRTQGVGAQDSVDLHFIGHSRGAVVISAALQALEDAERAGGLRPQLASGYVKMTMLDPHPAHNHLLPVFSALDNVFGWLAATAVVAFQAAAEDPEVTVPPNVNEAEVFFQHTPSLDLLFTNWQEGVLNLWGEVPVDGTTHEHDLTELGIGHGEVPDWYEQHVIPTLGLGLEAPLPAAASTSTLAQGSSLNVDPVALMAMSSGTLPSGMPGGTLDFLYPAVVDSRGVLHSLTAKLSSARAAASEGNPDVGVNLLHAFVQGVLAQRAKHITSDAADHLVALAQLAIQGLYRAAPASTPHDVPLGLFADSATSPPPAAPPPPSALNPVARDLRPPDNNSSAPQTARSDEALSFPGPIGSAAVDVVLALERRSRPNKG